MFKLLGTALLIAATLPGVAGAEEFRIKMLNKGDAGAMVFEPDFVQANPGDTIIFEPTDKGHNAESIADMWPAGADTFKSGMNVEFSVTLAQEGLYGIKCTPHWGMGMVALIQIGEPVNLAEVQAVALRGKAKQRLDPLIEAVAN